DPIAVTFVTVSRARSGCLCAGSTTQSRGRALLLRNQRESAPTWAGWWWRVGTKLPQTSPRELGPRRTARDHGGPGGGLPSPARPVATPGFPTSRRLGRRTDRTD